MTTTVAGLWVSVLLQYGEWAYHMVQRLMCVGVFALLAGAAIEPNPAENYCLLTISVAIVHDRKWKWVRLK